MKSVILLYSQCSQINVQNAKRKIEFERGCAHESEICLVDSVVALGKLFETNGFSVNLWEIGPCENLLGNEQHPLSLIAINHSDFIQNMKESVLVVVCLSSSLEHSLSGPFSEVKVKCLQRNMCGDAFFDIPRDRMALALMSGDFNDPKSGLWEKSFKPLESCRRFDFWDPETMCESVQSWISKFQSSLSLPASPDRELDAVVHAAKLDDDASISSAILKAGFSAMDLSTGDKGTLAIKLARASSGKLTVCSALRIVTACFEWRAGVTSPPLCSASPIIVLLHFFSP
jgi:hypothetical protein